MATVSVRGVYFILTLFLSSFFGSVFMLGPALPVMLLSPAWYRWLTDRIVATWLTLPVVHTHTHYQHCKYHAIYCIKPPYDLAFIVKVIIIPMYH